MFNDAIKVLGGFFSRHFWLGAFAPVAAAAMLHMLIASQVFPKAVTLAGWFSSSMETVTVSALAVGGLILAAYAIGPFTPLFRSLLDGTQLPGLIRHPLRRARYQAAYRARRKLAELRDQLGGLQDLQKAGAEVLEAAAAEGAALAPPPAAGNAVVEAQIAGLQTVLGTARAPDVAAIKATQDALAALLRAHTSAGDDAEAKRLDRLWTEFGDLVDAAVGLAETESNVQMSRSQLQWRLPASEATLVGDTRQAAERYSQLMYGVGFDYLWPRLQVGLDDKPDNTKTADDRAFDAARTQIDFAVLALVLSMTVPAVWLPLIGLHGTSLLLLLAVAAFGPLAWIFFYRLVVQSQAAFGQVVQAMIDRRRLDVLTAMGLPRPKSSGEERELWRALQAGEQGGPVSMRYQPVSEGSAT